MLTTQDAVIVVLSTTSVIYINECNFVLTNKYFDQFYLYLFAIIRELIIT